MSLRKLGKTFLVVGGTVGTVAAVVLAAPVLGPVGAIVVAGASIGEGVAVVGTVATALGTAFVTVADMN